MDNQVQELLRFKDKFENELHNILSYWIKYSIEENGKCFYGAVDLNNKPVITANKSCVLNARILWTFSTAAKQYNNSEYEKIAHIAYNVVANNFYDKVNGGYFMELLPDNQIANDIKHTYAQAFVLYSLSKYYELTNSNEVLEKVKTLFNLLEEKTKDKDNLGYFEAFTRDWQLYEENRMADNNEPKSMNTHLHVLEAYSALYKIYKDDLVRTRLTQLINIFLEKIIREEGHLGIFFDLNFDEVETSKDICSFGHDVESTWLLWEAVEILDDKELKEKLLPIILKMVDAVKRVGVDKDGGLFLESSRFGSHVRTNKHWWLQAENLVGFMNAYQLTKNLEHWESVKLAWDFIDKFVIDHEKGEWFTKVNRLGKPFLVEPKDDPSPYYRNDWKIDPWKCPYHNGRAMMELINRIDKIIN
ncbi:MAG: AGE family epimerase/isomerase [Ignavibacteriales bacterium]|nr:AGE family epimerase/isomerase [Ignavibacteriales bacterium]